MQLNLPTGVTVALSAAAGLVVAFIASNTIVIEHDWSVPLQTGLTILAAWGISPLTGAAFRTLLHLSNGASTAIAAALTGLQIVLTQVHMASDLHGVLAGVIAFAAGLGFAPAVGATVTRLVRPSQV